MSKIEIEIPRRIVWGLLATLGAALLIITGVIVSPRGEDGAPLLLTPRLACLAKYRSDLQRWADILEQEDGELTSLLSPSATSDLFRQDNQVSQTYNRLFALSAEIDGTAPPPTLEDLHAMMQATASAYLEAADAAARWVGEPSEENHTAALDSLAAAGAALQRVYQNPWYANGR